MSRFDSVFGSRRVLRNNHHNRRSILRGNLLAMSVNRSGERGDTGGGR